MALGRLEEAEAHQRRVSNLVRNDDGRVERCCFNPLLQASSSRHPPNGKDKYGMHCLPLMYLHLSWLPTGCRACAGFRDTLGADHPDTLVAQENLQAVLEDTGLFSCHMRLS